MEKGDPMANTHSHLTLRHKGNENGRGADRHATLDLNAVMTQRKAGKKTVLLLEVQPLQGAVVFLDDTMRGCSLNLRVAVVGGSRT